MRLPVKRVKSVEPTPNRTALKRVISGGQQGVCLAGVKAAKEVGFKTGGHILKGYLSGETVADSGGQYRVLKYHDKPGYSWMYGIKDDCLTQIEQEEKNVISSDATIRLGVDFNTEEQHNVLKAIRQFNRPHLDIFLEETWYVGNGEFELRVDPKELAMWLAAMNIRTLNISGSSIRDLETPAYLLLFEAFNILRWE